MNSTDNEALNELSEHLGFGNFRCPKCGSSYFRTIGYSNTGECKGHHVDGIGYTGCDFEWDRETEDESVGLKKPSEPVIIGGNQTGIDKQDNELPDVYYCARHVHFSEPQEGDEYQPYVNAALVKELIEASKYLLAEYTECSEKDRISVDCDGAANALSATLDNLALQEQTPEK